MHVEKIGPEFYMSVSRPPYPVEHTIVILDMVDKRVTTTACDDDSMTDIMYAVAQYENAAQSALVAHVNHAFIVTMHDPDTLVAQRLYVLIDSPTVHSGLEHTTYEELFQKWGEKVD